MSRIRADRYTNREGTGAPTFSEGVNVVGVTSINPGAGTTSMLVTGDLSVTSGIIKGASQLTISGITSSISDTAVDVFVYDTSKDSDGGAWRKRTQNTSWYNEAASATRGSRKEFPAVAVIVAETTKLTIYDGDDPNMPMWMVFNQGGSYVTSNNLIGTTSGTNSAISSLNGILSLITGNQALYLIKFISDTSHRITNSADREYLGGIGERNSGKGLSSSNSTNYIINVNCNDVAMTVLPNAPIDSATGISVPTIAVATNGGLSIIKDDGTVANNSRSTNETYSIAFDVDNSLIFSWGTTDGFPRHITRLLSNVWSVTASNTSLWPNNYFSGYNEGLGNAAGSFGGASGGVVTVANSGRHFGIDYGTGGNPDDRLGILHPKNLTNYTDQNLSAFITSSYNTGYMHGNIKLATLSDTDATNQTGGTVADRSINNNSLNVTGTITRTTVATGAELVKYTNWNSANYLFQPYNSDLNFTNEMSVILWVKDWVAATSLLHRGPNQTRNSKTSFYLYCDSQFDYRFTLTSNGSSEQNFEIQLSENQSGWRQVCFTLSGGTVRGFLNGEEQVLSSSTFTGGNIFSQATDQNGLWIGRGPVGGTYPENTDIALLRLSASAPSAEQVKKMYEDEKYLFQENSQATLYGSSDLPTALAYDDTTELLHVGTSAGRSEFQGLRRINNTTVGITTAISASNELVAEQ